MKKFLTLIKRDLSDNRGALITTPLVIAAVILSIVVISMLTGSYNFRGDNGFSINPQIGGEANATFDIEGQKFKMHKDAQGDLVMENSAGETKKVLGNFDDQDRNKASQIFASGSSSIALLPLAVAAITILFVLSSSLFEERKERSIMFWKSLPISDLQTVGAKLISIVGAGLGFALLVSIALHAAIMAVTLLGLSINGLNILNIGGIIGAAFSVWGILIAIVFTYILWALPVYAWFLAASAYAPKAPFLAAILPIALLPVLAQIFAPKIGQFTMAPLQHLTAEPMIMAIKNSMNNTVENVDSVAAVARELVPNILATTSNPSLLIGLVIAGGLIYLASEIRRRHAI